MTSVNQRIQGVIFDLDGTLYQLSLMKLRMSLMLWTSLKFLRNMSAARQVVRRDVFADRDALRNRLFGELARLTGAPASATQRWYDDVFMPAFVRLLERHARVRQALPTLLGDMRAAGVKLAVVSDFGLVPERLSALRIPVALFDVLLSAEETGVLKPHPHPLRAVSERWRLSPEQILMVGDRDDLDGACARAAGMTFLGVSDTANQQSEFFLWNMALSEIRARTGLE